MAKIINDAARNLNIAQRTKAISTASATADKACQPTPKVTYVVGSNVKMLVSGGEERTYTLTCTNPNDRVVDHTSNVGPLGSVDVHSNSVDYHLKKIGAGYDVDLYINTITCEA